MLTEKTLTFDWFDGLKSIKAWANERKEYGWAAPFLDFATSVGFGAAQNAERAKSRGPTSGLGRIWYKKVDDAFYVFEDDFAEDDEDYEPAKIEAVDIEGKHLYDWGNLGWTWEWEE